MTGIDKRMHLAARIKGMAKCFACLLAVFSPGLVLGQVGPVLPPQGPQVINGRTTLVVANTAVETNIPPGQQFATVMVTNHITFSYPNRDVLLANGWSFLASKNGTNRNTEITNSAQGLMIDYDQNAHPGTINVPCDLGDFFEINNNRAYPARNFLTRALSPNWLRIDLTVTFAPGTYIQQAALALYQDDDNYAMQTIGFAPWRPSHTLADGSIDPSTGGGDVNNREVWVLESGGTLPVSNLYHYGRRYVEDCPHVHCYSLTTDTHTLRIDKTTQFSAGYKADCPTCAQAYWTPYPGLFGDVGDPGQLMGYDQPPQVVNPRLAIWTGCLPPAIPGSANMILRGLDVISQEPAITLTYSLLNPPAGATIDANGIITWTPAKGQVPSTNVFTTVVADNSVPPVSATNSFTVVVQDINMPPVLPPQPDRTMSILNALTVTNTATEADPSSQGLSYQLTIAPPGATIDANGIISWTPGSGQQYTTNLFVTVVTDYDPQAVNAQSLSATNSFNVLVLPPAWPVLPNQSACTVLPFTALTVTNTAIDGALTVNQIATNTIVFNYANRAALLGDGWSFIGTNPDGSARNTETTAGAGVVDYNQAAHLGFLNIPCDVGDLDGTGSSVNNTRNSLFHSLPANWQSVRLALTFAPVTGNYQQAHLGLYQDDDNFLQVGVAFNSYDGNERFTMDSEIGGVTTTPPKAPTTSTSLNFRLDRNAANSTVTAYYSLDGVNWTVFGTMNLTLTNPRLMIWTGSYQLSFASGGAVMGLGRLDIVAGTPVPTVLNYTLINLPPGAAIDGNGIITWTPSGSQGLVANTITTVVTDNGVPPLSATNSFTVAVVEPPKPPAIKSVTMITGAVVITWDSAIGSTYRLQYKDDLGQTNWLDLLPDVTAAGHTMTTTNYIGSSPSRFFRALLLH